MQWVTSLLQSVGKPFQWWIVVATWEQGLRVRFGKRTKHLMPGVHFRMPFIDRVIRVCVRERVVKTACQTISTKDGKVLTVALSLRYYIDDARQMIESVARPEETLRTFAQSRVSQFVATTRSEDLEPTGLASRIDGAVGRRANEWGIHHIEACIITFAYARTIRLLQAYDNDYQTSFDHKLDENPTSIS